MKGFPKLPLGLTWMHACEYICLKDICVSNILKKLTVCLFTDFFFYWDAFRLIFNQKNNNKKEIICVKRIKGLGWKFACMGFGWLTSNVLVLFPF